MKLEAQIRNILLAHEERTITLESLKAQLVKDPPYADGSIENCLKNLSGIAQMTNGRWKIITIIK
jgi:hypothetical protein